MPFDGILILKLLFYSHYEFIGREKERGEQGQMFVLSETFFYTNIKCKI